jgi:hypothetical protein
MAADTEFGGANETGRPIKRDNCGPPLRFPFPLTDAGSEVLLNVGCGHNPKDSCFT